MITRRSPAGNAVRAARLIFLGCLALLSLLAQTPATSGSAEAARLLSEVKAAAPEKW